MDMIRCCDPVTAISVFGYFDRHDILLILFDFEGGAGRGVGVEGFRLYSLPKLHLGVFGGLIRDMVGNLYQFFFVISVRKYFIGVLLKIFLY